jgi:methyl-accepting chemotaxis protein
MKLASEQTQHSNTNHPQVHPRRFRVNSLGLRLFLVIMGGVLVGMGSMALLFGETVKFQAEDQIKSTLKNKVGTINDVIDQAETLAYGLNVSVTTLHVRRAETPETYQELVRQLFDGRPDFVTGLGFGQAEYGILPSQQWLFPYYYSVSEASSPDAEPSTEVASKTLYVDHTAPAHFYPESAPYRDYFLPQENRWTTPYQSDRGVLLTYYSQIFDPQGDWLGTVVIDVDGTHLSKVLDLPVLRNGGELTLLSSAGEVIANPANPGELGTQTYKDIPGLSQIWSQINADNPGFIEGETGYWAYTQLPERDWLLVAYVPYRVVFGRVMMITLGATTVVGLLLAGMVALVIRYLNRRLQPTLAVCQRLSDMDAAMMEQLQDKDEIDQLSASFFYLFEKHQQQPSTVEQATQRMQLLAKALVDDEGQLLSQWVAQVQQWAKATDDCSRTLMKQVLKLNTAGNESREALHMSQERISILATEIAMLREDTRQMLEQMHYLSAAADQSTHIAENHGHMMKVVQAVVSSCHSTVTRLANLSDASDLEGKVALFQRLTNRLQELIEQLTQLAVEQRNNKQQVESVGAYLSQHIGVFSDRQKDLDSHLEASQGVLERSRVAVNQMANMGEQVTHSSEELEELVQSIHHIIEEFATEAAPRA